jgi:hypothetical protein
MICIFAELKGDPMNTLLMAIYRRAIMVNNENGHKMTHLDMAIIMFLIDVSTKFINKEDQQPKQFLKYTNGKSYGQYK